MGSLLSTQSAVSPFKQLKSKFLISRLLLKMKPSTSLRALRPSRLFTKPTSSLTTFSCRANKLHSRSFTQFHPKMSFSNADTGSKPADPYKAKNIDETSIKEKVEDLSKFISSCKFGMMTTRDASSGSLISRCMALAAKVELLLIYIHTSFNSCPGKRRR